MFRAYFLRASFLAFLALFTTPAWASSYLIVWVHNNTGAARTLKLIPGHCYTGEHANETFTIQPNGKFHIGVQRDQGSRCDGDQGVFYLKYMDGPDKDWLLRYDFSNNGRLSSNQGTSCKAVGDCDNRYTHSSDSVCGGAFTTNESVKYDWTSSKVATYQFYIFPMCVDW